MKTETAKAKIAAGGFLMAEFDSDDQKLKYRVIPGGGVSPTQARRLISEIPLIPQADSLFSETSPQSWRKA